MPTYLIVLKMAVFFVVGIGVYVVLCKKTTHTPTWTDAVAMIALGLAFYNQSVLGFIGVFCLVRLISIVNKRSRVAG